MILLTCLGNVISGLDFSPLGTSMAAIDNSGVCLISDVVTNDYRYHIEYSTMEVYRNPSVLLSL